MATQQSISLRLFAIVIAVLLAALAVFGYYIYDDRRNLVRLESQLADLNHRLGEAKDSISQAHRSIAQASSSIAQVELSTAQANRELKRQLAVIRVALQQTTNIRIDSSGAVITRKGAKSNGIELR